MTFTASLLHPYNSSSRSSPPLEPERRDKEKRGEGDDGSSPGSSSAPSLPPAAVRPASTAATGRKARRHVGSDDRDVDKVGRAHPRAGGLGKRGESLRCSTVRTKTCG
jgi:hypothetical protein